MSLTRPLATAHLRVARPTADLAAVVRFYRDGLGFEVVGSFTGHDGFDRVMLGHAGAGYHLEFTRNAGHAAGKAPTPDNLLVFYLPDAGAWAEAVKRMEAAGYPSRRSRWKAASQCRTRVAGVHGSPERIASAVPTDMWVSSVYMPGAMPVCLGC